MTTPPTPYWAPRFWPGHLLTLVLVALAGSLGTWQWDAWLERRAAEARDLTQVAPVPLDDVLSPDQPFPGDRVGQPVVVAGEWLDGATVFVEREGGYWVVTPLAVGGAGEPAIPLVRGVAETPQAAPVTGYAELVGWLQPPEGAAELDPDPADDVLPQLRIADLVQRVDVDLYGGFAVVADHASALGASPRAEPAHNTGTEGLAPAELPALPESGRFTAARNLLYAIEWWVFGGFAVFVWLRYLSDTRAAEREPTEPIASAP